jgi:nitrogen regulatory protein P-II 1
MKKIETTIKAYELDEVRTALQGVGVEAVTAIDARDFGRQISHTEFYRGASYTVECEEKVRVEILIEDALAERTVNALRNIAGRQADATIMITTIEAIRTLPQAKLTGQIGPATA